MGKGVRSGGILLKDANSYRLRDTGVREGGRNLNQSVVAAFGEDLAAAFATVVWRFCGVTYRVPGDMGSVYRGCRRWGKLLKGF